ncbi:Schizosaccharomyces pombe specific protein [Schizosaccharomyces pombe]|uniref:Uncharacterized protein C1F8.08 n=1 Tax=Schizosaccharomyces pombe (strain 972 / ATCC 24843) TaxID=284812 RepID=YDI8_SCHPO|nr:uncharacterized protein SPAC1F8.08 [Schizosaccharomyces pombe]Q9C113.1 RecName: Full=Uncharacterized protein C1F8.08; Flags: Precursor [Schizosaccharomyces pombe 972h-]CAC34960.1 sequence orphan [Schizosaccharomyces pombe]|eukprot:NP_592797.1 uncharacterized protein SPAC1F8.08 [Schizosaccharomyces pombe]
MSTSGMLFIFATFCPCFLSCCAFMSHWKLKDFSFRFLRMCGERSLVVCYPLKLLKQIRSLFSIAIGHLSLMLIEGSANLLSLEEISRTLLRILDFVGNKNMRTYLEVPLCRWHISQARPN